MVTTGEGSAHGSAHGSAADLLRLSNGHLASILQRSICLKCAEVKKTRKPRRLSMHEALQQSVAQVKACTLQLQAQQDEQSSMRQDLQVMNLQSVVMLDKADAAAVHEQLHSHPD